MRILLTTDFSSVSDHAVDYAVKLFSATYFQQIEYLLVHAATDNSQQKQLEEAYKKLSERGVAAQPILHRGSIKEAVNANISPDTVNLVVMGSRDKSDEGKAIKSHAIEIAGHSNCSVLIVPNLASVNPSPGKIAFASDLNPLDVPREALLVLKSLLKAYRPELKVFHVYPDGDQDTLRTLLEHNANHYFVERSNHEYLVVINENIIAGIHSFIEGQHPDILTVIPRSNRENPSVTQHMAFDIRIPILVMR